MKAGIQALLVVTLLMLLTLVNCATEQASRASRIEDSRAATKSEIQALLDELREVLAEQSRHSLQRQEAADGTKKAGPIREALRKRVREIVTTLRARIHERFQVRVAEMLGLPQPLIDETVMLEAVDGKGRVSEVPVVVKTRKLRSLTEPIVARKALALFDEESLAPDLYQAIPNPLAAEKPDGFRRVYGGESASAIGMEAKLIITLKGGEWAEPEGEARSANAIAVRGLDLDQGLLPNSNKTYDDSVYVIIESALEPTEVFEYRMTTESSNERRGVGRLKSKQVFYSRGLHKGTDPAYRLVGNAAPGTRTGLEGEFQITGANIHSAYTSRVITSETPLSPNVSLGCQVVAASKSRFEESFVSLLDERGVTRFPYTIVEGTELEALDRLLRGQDKESILIRGIPR